MIGTMSQVAAVALALLTLPAPLPVVRYDAVIPALGSWPFSSDATTAYSLAENGELYDHPGGSPVATMPALDFLDQPTVVVVVDRLGGWARVLTAARRTLPSAGTANDRGTADDYGTADDRGTAAAQTSGWMEQKLLTKPVALKRRIVISVSAETLSIVSGTTVEKKFPVGVGTASTPTPTGVTGYLQERYFDPAQQQSSYPVQLTSLHSTAADEPFGGDDGGLIGLHFERETSGKISHGCVRLPGVAIAAVTALPLGTLVTIVP
jgi:hypothetical protein